MKSVVIQFPGSNCERDAFTVLDREGLHPQMLWHDDTALPAALDLIVIPGGFTYGDYLRVGAMAAHAPIMREVKNFAEKGGLVLGICNGFQILCETQLLPGTLTKNHDLQFHCQDVFLRVESEDTPFTRHYHKGQIISIPIAHHDGRYYAEPSIIANLRDREQIVFSYCDAEGRVDEITNPNGSAHNIAGICNRRRNVLGLMPHPERHADPLNGGTDGRAMFTSILSAFETV